ncbi:MAG: hypothetical protein IJH91_02710 [Mogibacterium sp.]|nr:hypothetical protein [Mogibacterium sp.]
MIKGTTRKRTFQAIYRLLDRVSPVPFDCGTVCGAACCMAAGEPDMGLYLLPGEDKVHDRHADWMTWGVLRTEDYEFPPSWHGAVPFIRCNTPPHCPRERRPIQCRSFPLSPHFTAAGELQLIYNDDDLPYCCPLIEDEVDLDPRFLRATYTVWRHLVRDPLIRDLVEMDSRARETVLVAMGRDDYENY